MQEGSEQILDMLFGLIAFMIVVTFAVSVYSYCYSVLTSNAQTDALKDTLRALHLYNVATQSYIDSLN